MRIMMYLLNITASGFPQGDSWGIAMIALCAHVLRLPVSLCPTCVSHINKRHKGESEADSDPCNRTFLASIRNDFFSRQSPHPCLPSSPLPLRRCPSSRPHLIVFPSPSSPVALAPTPPPRQKSIIVTSIASQTNMFLLSPKASQPLSPANCISKQLI